MDTQVSPHCLPFLDPRERLACGRTAERRGGVTGSIHWTFSVVDGALDFLAAGQTLVQSYAVTIGDFHNGPATQIVTVTLTGTNDLPSITATVAAPTGSVPELAAVTSRTTGRAAAWTLT